MNTTSPYYRVFNSIKNYINVNEPEDTELFDKIMTDNFYCLSLENYIIYYNRCEESSRKNIIICIYKEFLEYLLEIDKIEKQHTTYDYEYDEMIKLLTTYYTRLSKAAKKLFNPIYNNLSQYLGKSSSKYNDDYYKLRNDIETLLLPIKINKLVNSTNSSYYTKVIKLC